jgi:hypothetical protein
MSDAKRDAQIHGTACQWAIRWILGRCSYLAADTAVSGSRYALADAAICAANQES